MPNVFDNCIGFCMLTFFPFVKCSSGFYHDPNAGWYYCSKDARYYKYENGEYVPLEYDEAGVNPPPGVIVTCDPSEDDSGRKDAFAQAENVENECQVSLSHPRETPSGKVTCRVPVNYCVLSIIDN